MASKKEGPAGNKTPKIAKKKKKAGAPTKYRPEYCEMMCEYFEKPRQRIVYDIERFQNGELKRKKPVSFAPEFPTFERFAHKIGLKSVTTIWNWEKKIPAFRQACEFAREESKALLIIYGLSGDFDSNFAKFLLGVRWPKEYTEKQEQNFTGGLDISVNYGRKKGQPTTEEKEKNKTEETK